MPMTNKQIGSPSPTTPDWDQALRLVHRLASARRDIIADGAVAEPAEWDSSSSGDSAGIADQADGAVDREEFARAVAEIEQASAALRQAEPGLETWVKQPTEKTLSRKPRFVWALIVTLWLSTALVIAGAVTAIAYFIH
jgi:hypothetical protein